MCAMDVARPIETNWDEFQNDTTIRKTTAAIPKQYRRQSDDSDKKLATNKMERQRHEATLKMKM